MRRCNSLQKVTGYNALVTREEADKLLISGRYGDLLREAGSERTRAEMEARPLDILHWTLYVVHACRLIGRTNEALQHAYLLLQEVQKLDNPVLLAEAHLAQAVAFKGARDYDEAIRQLKSSMDVLPEG